MELEQSVNNLVDDNPNLLEETKEPLFSFTHKQDGKSENNEVLNHFLFAPTTGVVKMRDRTITELGMIKRKDVVLKSLLRKI